MAPRIQASCWCCSSCAMAGVGHGADQLTDQHHHRFGVGGSCGHGLGDRPQCAADHPGGQYRADGPGALAGDQPSTGRSVAGHHRTGLPTISQNIQAGKLEGLDINGPGVRMPRRRYAMAPVGRCCLRARGLGGYRAVEPVFLPTRQINSSACICRPVLSRE